MALTKVEIEWLDERFGRLDDKLSNILEQTQKTNGRVNELEAKESRHILDCPKSLMMIWKNTG